MQVIPIEERIEAYKYALANIDHGICITTGDYIYGNYMICPWYGWNDCKKYFPELKDFNMPKNQDCFTIEQRRKILTKAIELCTPSKSH